MDMNRGLELHESHRRESQTKNSLKFIYLSSLKNLKSLSLSLSLSLVSSFLKKLDKIANSKFDFRNDKAAAQPGKTNKLGPAVNCSNLFISSPFSHSNGFVHLVNESLVRLHSSTHLLDLLARLTRSISLA